MKVVIDTNVLVAAFAFGGICRGVLDVVIDSHELVTSEHILSEVGRILATKLGHSTAMAEERVSLLRQFSEIVSPVPVSAEACRDPDDLPVLGTILATDDSCLVTGDNDLLELGTFSGHRILSPRQFWEGLRA